MRVDDLGPRTWLLAGVAGWALLAWVLAVAGMGGRVTTLADDPDMLVALPQAVSVQAALGPPEQYQAIADRPLFASDRSPHPFFLEGGEEADPGEEFDYVLTSVLITPATQMAIVRRRDGGDAVRVKLDESLAQSGWRLVELAPRGAVFDGPQGRRNLELTVFEGQGAEQTSAALEAGRAPATSASRAARMPEDAQAPSPVPRPQAERRPEPAAMAKDATPAEQDSESAAPVNTAPEPAQAQMDSIRQRIEARRAALRKEEM
ncbi:general secretion pathway protein GspN [Novilysobacter antarcticus]|uniref:general secretion pathway protein GspN n=1 Tax=Novilysobacter antarcticus TaxID=2862543 RepID=UPI001C99796B|nr:general secretion pathway protein GspN [Lysobacter antarcticus]